MKRISHWINGTVVAGTSGKSGKVFNPATGEQSAAVDFASVAEVDAAVANAVAAFPAWRATNLSRRAEVMFHMRELVDVNRKKIAAMLSAEHGKVMSDALGEVASGLENIEYACGIPNLLKGGYSEQASAGVDVYNIIFFDSKDVLKSQFAVTECPYGSGQRRPWKDFWGKVIFF